MTRVALVYFNCQKNVQCYDTIHQKYLSFHDKIAGSTLCGFNIEHTDEILQEYDWT